MTAVIHQDKSTSALEYARQAELLSQFTHEQENEETGNTAAVEAKFLTPQDPVIATANGGRLPAVPPIEAHKLNLLKNEIDSNEDLESQLHKFNAKVAADQNGDINGASRRSSSSNISAPLRYSMSSTRTHPLFPPLPLYGPPTLLRDIQCIGFRISSFFLSLAFLGIIVLGSLFTSIPLMLRHIGLRLTFQNPDARRPFYQEEVRRREARREAAKNWKKQQRRRRSLDNMGNSENEDGTGQKEDYEPTEGGQDPIVCDVGYYARRVGLDVEEFKVQTEDGFIINLWHVYDPHEYTPASPEAREQKGPDIFQKELSTTPGSEIGDKGYTQKKFKYPVLMMHGLLQSAGAYCTNDDDSLAFFLCKSGYDVWLGNNRCGFKPEHTMLSYGDPRMWAWNIRQMGIIDLSALISRVLTETGFAKLGLVCHSQGTTETFVALAKEQRPELGDRISVFCALAPAVYAGPLIGKAYFKFMRVISPGFFRIIFGIHAFIPFMMTCHRTLPGGLYGAMGYRVFSFLFNWTDDRWERDLRDRMFQFAPVYVSAESMRWWLGRECFAKQKCILSTREENKQEEQEDQEDEEDSEENSPARPVDADTRHGRPKGARAWYNEHAPPFAMWVAGSDDLVDGRRLLRRFEKGREPFVDVVHAKVIEEYEHLDVIWAMDMIEKVGKEIRDVIWKTCPEEARAVCRVPKGGEEVEIWKSERHG